MSADGTWNVTLNSPMGAQAGTLELASDGKTELSQENVALFKFIFKAG